MPRASRNSQAAAASAVVPDDSLRTFYTHNPDISQGGPNTGPDSTTNDDSMWSRRGASTTRATTASTRSGTGGNTSNTTDLSVSSATNSLNSPLQSSHAASEASSYATRAIPGVIDEHDEDAMIEEEEEEEEVVVVVRSSTSNARRRRQVRQVSEDGTEGREEAEHEQDNDHSHDNHHHQVNNTSSHFSSRLLDESEEDELTNATAAGGGGYYHNINNGDNDSLIDATPEEVEARVLETLDWDSIGDDTGLYKVDLERWKNISEKHQTSGTPEYKALKEIQSDLLFFVQESEEKSWMYPEPLPFTTHIPEPSSTIGQKLQITLPFSNESTGGKGKDGNNWSDIAFNPLSTLTPLAPIGQATYPDTYRVQRALGAHIQPSPSTTSLNLPFSKYSDHDGGNSSMNNNQRQTSNYNQLGYHGNAIPKTKPDFTWLEVEAEQILGNQETNFALKSKFPWATALSSSNSNSNPNANPLNTQQQQQQQRNGDGRDNDSIIRGNGTSLTRDIGVIRLQ